jgi:fructose-specific phosphotransferase system IIC component
VDYQFGPMARTKVAGIICSVIGILLSGGIGGSVGWWLMSLVGAPGMLGAVIAVVCGMVIATAVYIALISAARSLRWLP